jgi:hypothetical protein
MPLAMAGVDSPISPPAVYFHLVLPEARSMATSSPAPEPM